MDHVRERVYRLGVWDSNLALLFPLLAWGVLIHKTRLPEPFTVPWPPLAALTAMAVLWLPRSVLVAELFAVSLGMEVAWIQPSAVNHSVYLLFITWGVVLLAVCQRLRARSLAPDPTSLEVGVPSLLRGGVYVLFSFAVLHKLNHGFLDPVGSCAVGQYAELHARLPFLPAAGPERLAAGLIGGTLATEAAIPLLLWRPSTRIAGLWLAFFFHFAMAINGHHAFSSLAPALYLPFLGESLHRRMARALRPDGGHPLVRSAWYSIVAVGTALGALILLCGVTGKLYVALLPGLWFFLVSYPAIFAIFLAVRDRSRPPEPFPGRPRGSRLPTVTVCLLALLVLNGMSPYLGLKTESSFAMYSNLRTEGGDWNHLLVPRDLQLFTFQDSVVFFHDVGPSAGELRQIVEQEEGMVPTHARRVVVEACRSAESPLSASFSVGAVSTTVPDLCTSPWAVDARSWTERHLLVFRPVPRMNVCTH